MSRTPRKIEDVAQLKALTHPLRVRILYALRAETTATASVLGQIVDESPASVSYHLRKLADAGFVEEAPDLGEDGRQRWWRVPEEGFAWSTLDFDNSPESRTTSNAAKRVLVDNQFRRQRDFDATAESWGDEWIHSAFSADNILQLTASETSDLYGELSAVIEKWRAAGVERAAAERNTASPETPPETPPTTAGREHVMVFAHGFPFKA